MVRDNGATAYEDVCRIAYVGEFLPSLKFGELGIFKHNEFLPSLKFGELGIFKHNMIVGGKAANVGVFKDADSRFEKGMIVSKAHETDESYVVTSHGLYPIRKIIKLPRGQQRDSTWSTDDKSKRCREKLSLP